MNLRKDHLRVCRSPPLGGGCVVCVVCVVSEIVRMEMETKQQLITMDILALETMKNAAKCDR